MPTHDEPIVQFLTSNAAKPRPTYEVRCGENGGWEYHITYPDGSKSLPRRGFWSEEAARKAARRVCDGDSEWHR